MATVNTKFIANPSFLIQSVGKQTITVNWRPLYEVLTAADTTTSPATPATGHYIGFADMPLGLLGLMMSLITNSAKGGTWSPFSPMSVSLQPSMTIKGSGNTAPTATTTGYTQYTVDGIQNFIEFLDKNPIHCTKVNVRASDMAYLPSTMEILTPNSFSGQYDRQIVNILADTNMYQNQSTIVTLDCDFYLTRTSIIRVDSSFDENSVVPALAMDFTFDKYLSLEKALVENYQLLQTNAGIENAIVEEVNTINAKTQDVIPATPAQPASMPVIQTQGFVASPWRRTIGSNQPVTVKGNNY